MIHTSETFGNRYFYIAFAAAFFIFSVLFLFLVTTVHPAAPNIATTESWDSDTSVSQYIPRREDSLNVLFIGTQPGGVTANTFILARFDPVKGSVPIAVLPPQTMLQNGERVEPMSRIYEYGGTEALRNALTASLGIPIDRYVSMSADIFVSVANAIGNVEFDLPYDLTIRQGGMGIILSSGKQLMDGNRVSDIIDSADYPEGELQRAEMISELTAAIVNQRIDVVESTMIDAVFERIINLIDSDITYQDYDDRKAAALFIVSLVDEPALPMQVAGTFSADGKEFELSDTFLAALMYNM